MTTLLADCPRTADTELRAQVLTHAGTDAMRVAVTFWLESDRPGSLADAGERALAVLREAFCG